MSKQAKRKITVNLTTSKNKESKPRPSVFDRLGTKAAADVCHHWAQNGTCPYGKGCKYSATHTLTSPSKQRKELLKKSSEHAQRRGPDGDWEQWDPEELAEKDPDDLEKRRQELQRELELQMKMESKAKKKEKKTKKESSPSTESSSTSSESSSSSDESSSSSSSSTETRRKKNKKTKVKRDSSSSSDGRPPKKKTKTKRTSSKSSQHSEKVKKVTQKTKTKSPSPVRSRKQSQTPPPKSKSSSNSKTSDTKSPRATSRSVDRKDKHRTPSPKPKEREKDKDRDKERERDREKERDKERDRDKDREREREKNRDKGKEKDRDRDKEKDQKKKDSKSPKRENKSTKDIKKRDSPDSSHSRDRKASPTKTKVNSRRDHKGTPPKDDRNRDKKDDKDRSRAKDRSTTEEKSGSSRKDRRDSRDRDRERERRLAREEREAQREKEREEALARCQERQRERERLKELTAKKERERDRDRSRREDRGLDKPSGDRVERLLPLPEDRVPPAARKRSPRDRRERTPPPSRKTPEKDARYYERDYGRHRDEEGARWEATSLKGRDWEQEYPDHDWDRARRPMERGEGWENWEGAEHGKPHTEEEWRLYGWTEGERRRWTGGEWRERSRSSTSHNRDDDTLSDGRRKEHSRSDPRSDRSDSKTSMPDVEIKKEAPKRAAEEPLDSPVEVKKPCVIEPALEDDLSEISDDADDILNRDEEMTDLNTEEPQTSEPTETSSMKDHPNSSASQKSQSPSRSPARVPKEESIDEDNIDLDFEEISEDELEEESRVKGIGDALGVDWASLVAESCPRVKPMTSAKRRWESHNVLVNLGVSVELAGEDLVKDILIEHAEAIKNEEKHGEVNVNGVEKKEDCKVMISHPMGALQVAHREKEMVRKALFSNVGPNCRALSARRDLMIRRHLCGLPLKDSYVEEPKRHDPELLKLAVEMFERCL